MTFSTPVHTDRGSDLNTILVEIPSGPFLMGSTDPDAGPYERPVHQVSTDAFLMGSAPVTNAEFGEFTRSRAYTTQAELGSDGLTRPTWRDFCGEMRQDHPVVCVSWNDAVAYCGWKTEAAGVVHRLPTEAEWEKAARGGLEQKLFPWGDGDAAGLACWNRWNERNGTMPVRTFAANGYGLHDMAGNVWEWCSDFYADHTYEQQAAVGVAMNPAGPATGTLRVRRGASWNVGEPFRMRCANRGVMGPDQSWPNMGFRVVAMHPQ